MSKQPGELVPTTDERLWLRAQLHSREMRCRQCELTRRVLDALDALQTPTTSDGEVSR